MTEPRPRHRAARAGAGPLPVLWVEDDPVLSDWVAQSLQEEGWPVLVAHDRSRALQLLEHEVPRARTCVALLDMGLPPRPSRPDEGLLLLSQLVARWPVLHAIVLTASMKRPWASRRCARALRLSDQARDGGGVAPGAGACGVVLLRQQELWAQGGCISVSASCPKSARASDQVAEQLIRHVLAATASTWLPLPVPWGWSGSSFTTHMKKFGIQRQASPDTDPGTGA